MALLHQPLTAEQFRAVQLLGAWTRNRFDIWNLAGNHHAGNRAILLSLVVGKRMPQSKAGVTALRYEFYTMLGIIGTCEAHREDNFSSVCRELLGVNHVN